MKQCSRFLYFVIEKSDGSESGAARLAGFSIMISNVSSGWLNVQSEICYQHSGVVLPQVKTTPYNCSAVGRYVTIYNQRNGSQPTSYSTNAVLELCEVDIPGKIFESIKVTD